jgi:biopolymer transport protein ExbB
LGKIKELLYKGDITSAMEFCRKTDYPIARLMERGLLRVGHDIRDIESAIESTARVEVYNMERNLSILSAIAAIAPMFGFLGTVMGMIKAFYNISISDNISIGIIAGGMYEKMVTSASGLIVGVSAYILYTLLNAKIDRVVNKMEVTAIEFLDLLHKPID